MTARSAAHQPSSSAPPTGPAALAPQAIASDPHALDELSRSLRETVREAARQSATLRASVAQAARVANELKASEQNQQENLALAAQAVKRIDERAREAGELLDKARATAPALEAVGTQVDALIEKRLSAFDARVQSMLAAAESRWLALEQRAGSAMRALDDRASGAANAASQAAALAAVQSTTRGVEQHLAPLVQRAENARDRLDVILAGFELDALSTHAAAATTPRGVPKALPCAEHGAMPSAASITGDPHALLPAELREGDAAAIANPLPEGGGRAWATPDERVSNPTHAQTDPPVAASPLVALLQRGESLRDEAAFANRQLDAVRQQADLARKILGESLNDMCTMIDRLAERAEDLRTQSDRARMLAEELSSDIAHKAEQARSETTEALAEARSQAQAATEDLSMAAAQARELVATTTLGNRVAEVTITQLRTLVEQLEPWQGCVRATSAVGAGAGTEPTADPLASLPMPVRGLVEQTREQMRRELRAVADALHAAAERAAELQPVAWPAAGVEPKREPVTTATFETRRSPSFELSRAAASESSPPLVPRPVVFTGQSLIERLSGPEESESGEALGRATSRSAASPLIPVTRVGVQTPVVLDR
jgi:hypothetical protein